MSLHALLSIVCLLAYVQGQFRDTTPQYQQIMLEQTSILQGEISSNPDVNLFFNPSSALLYNNGFTYDFPNPVNYRISMLMDPCRYNSYDCCMNLFGSAEYPSMKIAPTEQERVFKPLLLGSDDEVQVNYNPVYQDGTIVSTAALRAADDESVIDYDCVTRNKPYTYCMGKDYAFNRSLLRPACSDNNASVDSLVHCYNPDGTVSPFPCVQIGYTQNTFIGLCSTTDEHCGTFLEIHRPSGTPYSLETDVIAEVQLNTRNVSGMYTTVLPLTWQNNASKVLCSYSESFLRINAMVYIKPSAPVCCCPKPFKPATRVGSFQCPIGPVGTGPYAYAYKQLADVIVVDTLLLKYPFCNIDLSASYDSMMCSVYDEHDRRHFIRNCSTVTLHDPNNAHSYTSLDMDGIDYFEPCPYFSSCATTLEAGHCRKQDLIYTFIGQVGKVTALDNNAEIPQVWVTFNDGRTSYQFSQADVKLELTKSMYEVWWVVRTKSNFVVQKKHGFNVTNPICTFDLTNNRYFPFAELDYRHTAIDSSLL